MGSLENDGVEPALGRGKNEDTQSSAEKLVKKKGEVRRRRPRSRFGSNEYIPPFRAGRRTQAAGMHDQPVQVQMDSWTAMKKKINGVINRLNASNIRDCVIHLFRLNLIRGRGLFCKALMRAQLASADFSDVYAALISIINTRMPAVGELIVCRLIAQLKEGYAQQEKLFCVSSLRFLSQLYNQQVINELPLLEFMSTCLIDPSGSSIELAVLVIRECGHCLSEKSPRATEMVFTRLREVLHDNVIETRMQTLVDNALELRRTKFRTPWSLRRDLDIVDDDDVIPHFFSLEDVSDKETMDGLNTFTFEENFDENESKYGAIRDILLGEEVEEKKKRQEPESDEAKAVVKVQGPANNAGDANDDASPVTKQTAQPAEDMTGSKLVDFRRIVYLKIMSAASYEECAHKLTKLMRSNRGKEVELCNMVIECCSQEKTFLRYYGLLGQRLCLLQGPYVDAFEENFAKIYGTVHRYDTRKIRNIASFYASLLASNALPWAVMTVVHLVEEETTASSRIFLKILFQEVMSSVGSTKLLETFRDEKTAKNMSTVFRRDEPKNIRFAINFFTSIGLGVLTEDLRDFLNNLPKTRPKPIQPAKEGADDDDDSVSSSSLSSSSLSSSSGISDDNAPPVPVRAVEDRQGDVRKPDQADRSRSPRSRSPSRSPIHLKKSEDGVQSRRRSHSPTHRELDRDMDRPIPRERSPRRASSLRKYKQEDSDDYRENNRTRSPLGRSQDVEGEREYNRERHGGRRARSPSPRAGGRKRSLSVSSSDSRRRSRSHERRRYSRRESSSPESKRRSQSPHGRRHSRSYSPGRRSLSTSSTDSRRRYVRRRSPSSSPETRKRKASPFREEKSRKGQKVNATSRRRSSGYSSDSSRSRSPSRSVRGNRR